MSIYISGERCPNIMTSGVISTVELIEKPTDEDDKVKVLPGGAPYTTNENETDIIVSLQSPLYSSGDVTKIVVTSDNVETITIYIQNENGDWVPLNPQAPGSNQPQEFTPNDFPVVLKPRFKDAVKVKITLTREDDSEPMLVDVDIWACLESG